MGARSANWVDLAGGGVVATTSRNIPLAAEGLRHHQHHVRAVGIVNQVQ